MRSQNPLSPISKKMKPHPRKRSKFLSFLLCSTSTHCRSNKKQLPFSPPRRSILEYDDDDKDSICDETVRIGRMEKRGSFRAAQDQESVDTNHVWSIGSRFQNTPSPVCSTCCSPVGSDSSGSAAECNFSTPRNQSPSKVSVSSVDIDDWIRDGRKRPYRQNPQATKGEEGNTWMSCSSVYESAIGGLDQMALASIHEEETNEIVDEEESPFLPYHKLLSRPKPYHEFLNEVEKQEFESKVHAWDEALHTDHIEKLRKREAAIKDWEMKQTRKAARELEELEVRNESKQKRELAKAMEKLQQKMSRIQSKAAEKKAKGRLSCVSSDDANIYSSMVKLSI